MARKRILPVDAIVELKAAAGGKAVPTFPTSIPRPAEPVADFDDTIPF